MFEGKDLDDNLQDQMYALAVHKLYPEFLKVRVEFPFLQLMPKLGDEAVVKMENQSKSDVEGFEYVLTELQKYVDSFSERDAVSNMAYYKSFPNDNSFSGRLLCGFDDFNGQLKKDGSKRWGCAWKWPFDYYCVRKKRTKRIVKTYMLDEYDKIEYDTKTEKLYLEKYLGCPAWNKKR